MSGDGDNFSCPRLASLRKVVVRHSAGGRRQVHLNVHLVKGYLSHIDCQMIPIKSERLPLPSVMFHRPTQSLQSVGFPSQTCRSLLPCYTNNASVVSSQIDPKGPRCGVFLFLGCTIFAPMPCTTCDEMRRSRNEHPERSTRA
jgi:hypothetical protein